jgi:hypothetical protein
MDRKLREVPDALLDLTNTDDCAEAISRMIERHVRDRDASLAEDAEIAGAGGGM